MKSFNLARWAVKHRPIVYFFIVSILIAGIVSFFDLGRREDPDFSIRSMTIAAAWPGATAEQMNEQVTDKIEQKLQDTPGLDYIKSFTNGDTTVIYVWLREDLPKESVRPTWTDVRNLTNDVWRELPKGVVGPFMNDRFDDVYGSIYALTGDDFSYEEKREYAETLRRQLMTIPEVQKVKLIGVQEQTIYIEMEEAKLAQLGIDPRMVFQMLQQQGTLLPAGSVRTGSHNVALRITGLLDSAEAIQNLSIHMGERSIRLGDIATVKQAYADPQNPVMVFNGKESVGIAISMAPGGNVLNLGDELTETIAQYKNDLPVGLEIGQVTNQPEVVTGAINEFTRALAEAIVIVLLVSFLALGWRSGAVVALCIPVVVAATFIVMHYFAIDLQVVSLGALIISLGLLVDDAIIVVEMMQRKLEEGVDRLHAATAAYEITAFPMLSGTLITAAAFIPIGLARGIVAEYTASLFSVTAIALLISWFASVLVSPVLGYRMIKVTPPEEQKETRWSAFQKKLLNGFKNSLETVLRYRKTVVLATIAAFLIAAISYPLLKKEFFPASVRQELIVETELPLGATQAATKKMTNEFTAHFYGDNRVSSITSYIGESAPRFILPFEPVPPRTNYAQTVIVATDADARRSLQTDVEQTLADHFPDVRSNIRLIQTGPPAPYPIMYRLSGPDTEQLQKYANEVVQLMQKDKEVSLVNMDWPQMTPSVEVKIDQDRIRQLGADNYAVAADLYTKLSGYQVSSAYLGDQLVPVKFRLPPGRQQLGDLANLAVHVGGGRYVPLGQFATLTPTTENTMIWRRNLTPTITIRANVADDTPADTVSERIYTKTLADFRENLPAGYALEYDGSVERSHTSVHSIVVVMPVMIFVILMVLMFQLGKIKLMILAAITAPLGLIGSIIALQLTRKPLGFVAILGIIALSGMIIRNSIILLDQIETHRADGEPLHEAVINAAMMRFRPIMLTALAAILGMIPLMRSYFWGPMAFAFSGGLLIATLLTLFFLPAIYTWVYRREE